MFVDPNFVSRLPISLDLSTSAEERLSNELSSGLRVNSLSDDPTAVAQSTLLNTARSQEDSFVQTASSETSRLQAADSTLGEVVTQLTSAISLATQGGDGTLNDANRSTIAQQLTSIRDSILGLANSSYGGTYLFSGSQGQTQPFSLDTSTTPATVTYAGDGVTQSIETPSGQKIQVNLPGSDIFTASGASVLGALNQLIADFSSASLPSSMATDATALSTALHQVSSQRSVLDNSLSRIQTASTYAQTQVANLTAAQNQLVAADTGQVATDLSSAETQHQALLSVISGLEQQEDLFGYIR